MPKVKEKIQRKLLGRIEKREGQYVFVLLEPKPKKIVQWVPYPDN